MKLPIISEQIIVQLNAENCKYGVTEEDFLTNTIDDPIDPDNRISKTESYEDVILRKLSEFDIYDKSKFLEFQLRNVEDPKKWIHEFENLIQTYEYSVKESSKRNQNTIGIEFFNIQYEGIQQIIDKLKEGLEPTKKKTKKKSNSFKLTQYQFEKLSDIIKLLHSELCLFKDEEDSIDEIISMLGSEDFSKINKKITLDIKTNVFAYLVKRLSNIFNGINYASIENSGLFFSKRGNQIKASSLSSSNRLLDDDYAKKIIDKIL
ncbi:MAG: hypothetical protein NXI00_18120 [Cytophagales bacterium]|nr:hypothetical protein [Cytophagales bacterium]